MQKYSRATDFGLDTLLAMLSYNFNIQLINGSPTRKLLISIYILHYRTVMIIEKFKTILGIFITYSYYNLPGLFTLLL